MNNEKREKIYPQVGLVNLDEAEPEIQDAFWVIATGFRKYSEEQILAAKELIEKAYKQKT